MKATDHDFETDAWCQRLSRSLESLTADIHAHIPYEITDQDGHTFRTTDRVAYDQYRDWIAGLPEKDRRLIEPTVSFRQSHRWFERDQGEAEAILQEHPVIQRALSKPGGDVWFLQPYGASRCEMRTLALNLTKLGITAGWDHAVRILDRLLMLGERRELRAYEITLLDGLELETRLDLGEGAYLDSYDEVASVYGPHPSLDPDRWPADSAPRSATETRPVHSAALVRELTWGPAVASDDHQPKSVMTTHFAFSFADDIIDAQEGRSLFPSDHETIRDLLAIVTGKHQRAYWQYVCMDKWVAGVDPNLGFPWAGGGGFANDWWTESKLDRDGADEFVMLARARQHYGGDGRRIDHAVHRLAAAVSRIGRFRVEDRILDAAIALETMYGRDLDPGEITYKLKTRAAFFLGTNSQERRDIFRDMGKFYDARSSVAHGSPGTDHFSDELAIGLDLAKRTLTKMMLEGEPSDWQVLIMSVGEGDASG